MAANGIMINLLQMPIKSIQIVDMGIKGVCCYDDKYSKDVQYYRGENAVYKFLEKNLRRSTLLQKHYQIQIQQAIEND